MNWALLFVILAFVESGGDPNSWNKDEDARGILQIRPNVIVDVNERFGTNFVHNDAFDPAQAKRICRFYLTRWGAKNLEQACRIWNGGPDGYLKDSTLEYWRKCQRIKQLLEKKKKGEKR